MKTLKEHLNVLQDLKAKKEIAIYRYYNRENLSIILNLIADELTISWNTSKKLERETYLQLANSQRLSNKNIKELCLIYKKIINLNKMEYPKYRKK